MQYRKFCLICVLFSLTACSSTNVSSTFTPTPVSKSLPTNPCKEISSEDPGKPAFKGMELYSFQESVNGEWVFSVLYGTNRNKMVREVKSIYMDLSEVEQCFCNMPENEEVFWMVYAQQESTGELFNLPSPPDDLIGEVEKIAGLCLVKLHKDAVHKSSAD